MPSFSARSAARLAECHPDLQLLMSDVIKTHDFTVLCGARSKAEQDEAVAKGNSKARWPSSNHNVDGVRRKTSWAVDIAPYPIDWQDHARFEALAAYVKATAKALLEQGRMKHRLAWGGDWYSLVDMPHFELVGVAGGE